MEESEYVELHFPLKGEVLGSHHSFELFSAVCKRIPAAHDASWLGIHSIKGRKVSPGVIQLARFARLRIRLPLSMVPTMLPLSGAQLRVGQHTIQCGVPEIQMLRAAKDLRSRMVILKTKEYGERSTSPDVFIKAVQRQLDRLGVVAEVELERALSDANSDLFARRTLKIKQTTLAGYGVILRNLSDRDSMVLQSTGLGGRRRMGCGLLSPLGRQD